MKDTTTTRTAPDALSTAVAISYPEHYTTDDRMAVERVRAWLDEQKNVEKPKRLSQTWLGRVARVAPATLSQILTGTYPSSPTKQLRQTTEALDTHEATDARRVSDFVSTATFATARATCHRARMLKGFGVLTGKVGTGKTFALKEYERQHPNTYMVEAYPAMNPKSLLTDLAERARVTVTAGRARDGANREVIFRALVARLKETNSLVIVDEAEQLAPAALEYLRRLRDMAGIGIVLAGTEKLGAIVLSETGHFDQIRSRVVVSPATILSAPREDADALASAGLGIELEQAVLDELWSFTGGSVRLLCEALIPAIKDYILLRGLDLTPDAVEGVADRMLGLSRVVKS